MSKFEKITSIINIFVQIIMGACSIGATIFVGISANRIAVSANETARLQALIAKSAEAPTIEVVRHDYTYESQEDIFHDMIEISILDGKYSNFKSELVSFMVFSFSGYYGEPSRWASFNEVQLPIAYYDEHSVSNIMYGIIETWSDKANAEEINLLQSACEAYYEENQEWSQIGFAIRP